MKGTIIRRGKHSWRCKFDIGCGPDGRRQTRYLTVRGTPKECFSAYLQTSASYLRSRK